MTLQETIQQIRKECRLAMNGVASSSMREKGLTYKLNFGLMQEQIKRIAGEHAPDSQLAELLWQEETRELKIFATLLYPTEKFTEETADRWLAEIPNQEIREQVCINLFQRLPFAENKAMEWVGSSSPETRITGYWLLARLILRKGIKETLDVNRFPFVWDDIYADDLFLRNAALLVLKHTGRQSKQEADNILAKIVDFKGSANPLKQEAYNNIAFEFEFFFG